MGNTCTPEPLLHCVFRVELGQKMQDNLRCVTFNLNLISINKAIYVQETNYITIECNQKNRRFEEKNYM